MLVQSSWAVFNTNLMINFSPQTSYSPLFSISVLKLITLLGTLPLFLCIGTVCALCLLYLGDDPVPSIGIMQQTYTSPVFKKRQILSTPVSNQQHALPKSEKLGNKQSFISYGKVMSCVYLIYSNAHSFLPLPSIYYPFRDLILCWIRNVLY